MSLIQEALQRQKEEAAKGRLSVARRDADSKSPEPPPPPPPPPAEPEPPRPPEPPEEPSDESPAIAEPETAKPAAAKSRTWATLLTVLVILFVLIGGSVWMLIFAFQQINRKTQTLADEAMTIAASAGEPAAEQPASKPSPTVAAAPASPEPATTPEPEPDSELTAADPTAAATPQTAPETTSGGDDLVTDEIAATPPVPEPAVIWPPIMLSAVLGQGNSGAAILNGKIVEVGRTHDGVKLLAVGKQSAKLEYQGETLVLRVGNATR